MCDIVLPAYISFTNPALWAGSALAAFPIAAHLLTRYARGRRVFPSLMLLQRSVAQQSRIRNLRRWILLTLRCLFVLAIAAAFSRPVWRSNRGEALAAAQGNAAVLLIDASASMQVRHGGAPIFDIAKAEADRVLDDLRRGTDLANVIFVASRPRAIFQELSPNLPALQEEIQRQAVTQEKADVLAGLRMAGQMLRDFKGPRRIVVISDLQAISWRAIVDSWPADLLPSDTQVSVIDLNVPVAKNVSVNLPRNDPLEPLVGQTVKLTAQLHNHADQWRHVRVTARIDRRALPEVQVTLEPGQRRDVSFDTTWKDGQHHEVGFEIDHDQFEVDDRCFWVTHANPGIRVALVSDDDLAEPGTAGYYVSLALAPHGDGNDRFVVEPIKSRDLPTNSLDDNSTVFVAYVGQLERLAAKRLLDYVQDGGTCIVLCGQGPVRRNLLRLDELSPTGCLPWLPGPRQNLYDQRQSRRISGGRWRARLLRDFDETSQIALARIRFGSIWRVEQVRAEADVLLSFDDGTPALASRQVGRGLFVVANFSPDDQSSDLGRHGAFVALTQILAQNLRQADGIAERLIVGQPIHHRLSENVAAANVVVSNPQGKTLQSTIIVDGSTTEIQVASANMAGFYRFRGDRDDIDAVAVNLDPSESELSVVPIDRVRRVLAEQGDNSRVVDSGNWRRPVDLEGQPLWGWMILLAMSLIGCELTLLGWWRR